MNEQQDRVRRWVFKAFGAEIALNRKERALRVVEEAIELCQAEGVACTQVMLVAARTYSRPVGEPSQEAAGIGVTLLAWGAAAEVDIVDAVDRELDRVERPDVMDAIRLKQALKRADGISALSSVVSDG